MSRSYSCDHDVSASWALRSRKCNNNNNIAPEKTKKKQQKSERGKWPPFVLPAHTGSLTQWRGVRGVSGKSQKV
jgi:hypothetical protein